MLDAIETLANDPCAVCSNGNSNGVVTSSMLQGTGKILAYRGQIGQRMKGIACCTRISLLYIDAGYYKKRGKRRQDNSTSWQSCLNIHPHLQGNKLASFGSVFRFLLMGLAIDLPKFVGIGNNRK